MVMLRLLPGLSPRAQMRRELQECCTHQWLTGTVLAPRLDPDGRGYGWGPVFRKVCLRCDKAEDRAVRNRPLKDSIRLNAPSQTWLDKHAPGCTVTVHEVDDGIVVR